MYIAHMHKQFKMTEKQNHIQMIVVNSVTVET